MANLEKDHSYSGNPQQPVATAEESAVPEVVITRRLRDRELLRKRKAEAEEKDTHQWVLGQHKRSKPAPARRGRRAGRGRGRHQAPEPQAEPDPEVAEEKHETPATELEGKAPMTLDLQIEPSVPLLEIDELYTQQQVAEAAPAEGVVFSGEASHSEEPEFPQSLENDHLEQDPCGST
ncbi:hemogen isoform X2 [Elgaria multicarinata webbii]|uniref:hemogen isoform X2 n=1 Tax=Elgaria multicarinata webbii TaxID=159646 RepID=UPI002FCD3381